MKETPTAGYLEGLLVKLISTMSRTKMDDGPEHFPLRLLLVSFQGFLPPPGKLLRLPLPPFSLSSFSPPSPLRTPPARMLISCLPHKARANPGKPTRGRSVSRRWLTAEGDLRPGDGGRLVGHPLLQISICMMYSTYLVILE